MRAWCTLVHAAKHCTKDVEVLGQELLVGRLSWRPVSIRRSEATERGVATGRLLAMLTYRQRSTETGPLAERLSGLGAEAAEASAFERRVRAGQTLLSLVATAELRMPPPSWQSTVDSPGSCWPAGLSCGCDSCGARSSPLA